MSPFSVRSPSPESEPHQILPAVTKPFQPRPLSPRAISPSPKLPPPPIIIPEQAPRKGKKERQLPKLQFMYPPPGGGAGLNSVSKSRSFIPPPRPQSPLSPIKSPRSLPRNLFKFPPTPSSGPSLHSPSGPSPQSSSLRRDLNLFPSRQNHLRFPNFNSEYTRSASGSTAGYRAAAGGNFPGPQQLSRSKNPSRNTLQLNLKPTKNFNKGPGEIFYFS